MKILPLNNTQRYFDSQAEVYNVGRNSGILGKIVNKERDAVLHAIQISSGELILDAGCGAGYYSLLFKKLGAKPYGIDISHKMIEVLKNNGIKGEVANIERFNLGRKFFVVFCGGALEFLNYPNLAITAMSNHIKEGGTFVMIFPRSSLIGQLYKMFHRMHGVRINLFSDKQITDLLSSAGLSGIHIKKVNVLTNLVVAKKY